MAQIDVDEFFAELDALREDEVRKRLASKSIWGGARKTLAEEWLRREDQRRADAAEARMLASNREQIRIARSAKNAAWAAATAAIIAAICAIIALTFA